MSQPPQNGWGPGEPGQPGQPDQPYGQPSPNGGYGGYGDHGQAPQGGYGQPSPSEGYGGYGQDPSAASNAGPNFGSSMPNQGEPPKTSNAKIPLIICAGCAVLALIIAILGGGIFLFTRDSDDPTGGGETTTVDGETAPEEDEPTDEEPTDEDPTEDEPTDEQTTDDGGEEGGGAGTQDQPFAIGETFTLEDGQGGTLDITVGEIDWDATDSVMEANQFNTEPEEGQTYILMPLSVTYHGDGEIETTLLLNIEYLSGAGNSHRDHGAVTPRPNLEVGALQDGDTGEWDHGMLIPVEEAQDGGAISIGVLSNVEQDDVWVAAE